jgi:hypothetical protein
MLMLIKSSSTSTKTQKSAALDKITVQKSNSNGKVCLHISLNEKSYFFVAPKDVELDTVVELIRQQQSKYALSNTKSIVDKIYDSLESTGNSPSAGGEINSTAQSNKALNTVYDEGLPENEALGPRNKLIRQFLLKLKKRSHYLKAFSDVVIQALVVSYNNGKLGTLSIAPHGLEKLDFTISENLRLNKSAVDLYSLSNPFASPAAISSAIIVNEFKTSRAQSSLYLVTQISDHLSSLISTILSALSGSTIRKDQSSSSNMMITWPDECPIGRLIVQESLDPRLEKHLFTAVEEFSKCSIILKKALLSPQLAPFKRDAGDILYIYCYKSFSPLQIV